MGLPEECRKLIEGNSLLLKVFLVIWILVGGFYIGHAVGAFIANIIN